MFTKIKTLVLGWLVKRKLEKVQLPDSFVEAMKEDARQMANHQKRHCLHCANLYSPTAPNQLFCCKEHRMAFHKIRRHGK